MKSLKSRIALLVAVLAVTLVGAAYAQLLTVNNTATTSAGITITVKNAIDSVIVDGTVVEMDTTTASMRFIVRPYGGTSAERYRVCGLAYGNIPKSTNGGLGKVLIWGYHARAKLAASGDAAKSPLKLGFVHGSLSIADSLSMSVGYLYGMTSATPATGTVYQGKVFWYGLGGKTAGAL